MPRGSVRDRFEARVIRTDDCWEWSGAHFQQNGYALFNTKAADGVWRPTTAHRVSYELYIGAIPDGLVIDHLCRNHGCVNPAHLEAVTRRENTRRGNHPTAVLVREGVCSRGHAMEGDNVAVRPNGKRECRTCVRMRDRVRNADGGRREHYAAMYRKRKAASAPR